MLMGMLLSLIQVCVHHMAAREHRLSRDFEICCSFDEAQARDTSQWCLRCQRRHETCKGLLEAEAKPSCVLTRPTVHHSAHVTRLSTLYTGQAAYDFNLKYSATFSAGDVTAFSSSGIGSGSGSGIADVEEHRWLAVSQSLTAKLAPAADQSKKAGFRTFDLELPIHERMQTGGLVRFPICPGSSVNELAVSLPVFGASAKSLRFRVELSEDGAKGSSVRING